MSSEGKMKYSASATLPQRLGEEMIRDSHTAFSELIKNSFDADATEVTVRFQSSPAKGGYIVIEDNGSGMSKKDIQTKWLRAGGESKVRDPYSPVFKRRRQGKKGIGRFSVGKLGSKMKLVTKTPGIRKQIVIPIDFSQFTDDKDLNDMEATFKEGTPRSGFQKGTIIEITGLHDKWAKREIAKLRNELSHLVDPEKKDQNFSVLFDCPDYPELSGKLSNPIAGQESHRVEFSVDPGAKYNIEIVRTGGKTIKKREKRLPLLCGPVHGILRYYKEGIKSRDKKLSSEGEESHMGVKAVRDGFRVRPYGEERDDWLQVRTRKARAGGKYYVRPDLLAGTVYISAITNPALQDETNRESGMIANKEFYAFQDFVREQVNRLNETLEQETRSESHRQKRQTVQKILNTIVKCVNKLESELYKGYIEKLDRTHRGESGLTSEQEEGLRHSTIDETTKKEWGCLDCENVWRTLKATTPKVCMEYAVNRKGEPRDVSGCGSSNIEPASHEYSGQRRDLGAIVSGEYAVVSGKKVIVKIDPDMGEREEEFRFSEREIVINGNHPAFKVAERLDAKAGMKYEMGDTVYHPAKTTQITKCVCLAWGHIHYKEGNKNWEDCWSRYDELLGNICDAVLEELQS